MHHSGDQRRRGKNSEKKSGRVQARCGLARVWGQSRAPRRRSSGPWSFRLNSCVPAHLLHVVHRAEPHRCLEIAAPQSSLLARLRGHLREAIVCTGSALDRRAQEQVARGVCAKDRNQGHGK